MSERIIVGPCLTRAQAARREGVTQAEVRTRPDLLRLSGRWLEETYFAFQFDDAGVRPDLGAVVLALKDRFTDDEIADWLVRPQPRLDHLSPLAWIRSGRSLGALVAVEREAGPVVAGGPALPARPRVAIRATRGRPGWRRRAGGVAPVH